MRFSPICAAAAIAALAVAAPAAGQTAAPSAPTGPAGGLDQSAPSKAPVANIFKFTPKTVTTTGPLPQAMVRIDHQGAKTFTLRLVLTPRKRTGKKVRKVVVSLGKVPTGEVAIPVWPSSKKLVTGSYKVRLSATGADGSRLSRPTGARGITTLKVTKGKATIASIPGIGGRMLALAQAEVGVAEAPKGSNDSPRIAVYRASTPGGLVGPWCAYFTSWLARTAGFPLGERGQGYGRVDDLYAWAKRAGKAIPAIGAPIQPGDFMVWDEHIGVVESINADGSYTTIDGNYADAVTRRVLTPTRRGPVVGYVRL